MKGVTMSVELNERVLEDDYPIFGDYLYVVDNDVYRSDWHGITVAELKKKLNATTIMNCDIFGRRKMMGLE
jgi:hypothetical protein